MHQPTKLAPFEEDRRSGMLVMLASVLVVLGVGYVLLLMHPELVKNVGAFWQARVGPGGGAQWVAPSFAAGVAIGGAAVGVYVMSSFVRGVQRAPYVWLAPVLVGFSCLVLSRAPIELPVRGLTVPWFAAITAFLWLGGGALMQQRSIVAKVGGALLITTPVAVFACGHVLQAGGFGRAFDTLGAAERFFAFVTLLSWLGVGFMALVTQDLESQESAFSTRLALDDTRARLADALEHARLNELGMAEAEQRAYYAEQQLAALSVGPASPLDERAFAEATRPKMSGTVKVSLAVLALTAVAAGLYFGVYFPMAERIAKQSVALDGAAGKHAAELDALRKHFDAQRAQLAGVADAERRKAEQAHSELEAARSDLDSTRADLAARRADDGVAAKPAPATGKPAKAARRSAAGKRAKRAPRQSTRKAAPQDDSAGLGGALDDDPIGGLL